MHFRVEIGKEGARSVAAFLERWSNEPALRQLIEAEGGTWPDDKVLRSRLDALYEFSERWDFRKGGERLDITGARTAIPDETILDAAAELGLAEPQPPRDPSYDHAIVLGGTALACYYRTRHAAALGQRVRFGQVALLGALRPLGPQEPGLVAQQDDLSDVVGEVPATEYDVMVDAATRFFSPDGPVESDRVESDQPGLSAARTRYESDGTRVTVIAASSPDPTRRASTIENIQAYADEVRPSDSVLVVTSTIYTPYQFFVVARALGWQRPLTLELTSFPPAWMSGTLTAPHNYLQETRSALFGALALARELDAAGALGG